MASKLLNEHGDYVYFMDVVVRAAPGIVVDTRLEPGSSVAVVKVQIQQSCCSEDLVDVERTETTHRLVTKQNLLVPSQDAFLVLSHCTDVEVTSATPL